MPSRILEYLDQNGVDYIHHLHPDVYSAREVASAEHVPTHEVGGDDRVQRRNHRDVIRLRFRDYESLVKPIVVNFARVVAA